MITNRLNIQFIGHVGNYDVHYLKAKGLKRLFATNTEDGNVVCPDVLVEKSDLGQTDYNICVDIFQHIFMSPGTESEFSLKDITWRHSKSAPDEITMRAFVKRYGFDDLFDFQDANKGEDFHKRTTVSALFILRFNLIDTGFLSDMEGAGDDGGNE